MATQPSFYSILTADVRYNKKLSPSEKIMFAEITAMSNKYGFCSASNNYFAELYDVSKTTISRWISDLIKEGYIKSVLIKEGKEVKGRKLYPITSASDKNVNTPINKNVNTPLQKSGEGINKNVKPPINKNVKENNTSINNTSINNIYMSSSGELNQNSNKNNAKNSNDEIPYERIIDYLNRKTNSHFRATTKEYRKLIRGRFADGYVAEDFKRVIDNKCKEWANTEMVAYLTPNTLFKPSTFDTYLNQKVINPKHKNKDYKPLSNWSSKKQVQAQSNTPDMTEEEMNRIFKEFASGSK